ADEVKRLFAEHGESALHRLRGAFAIALWDEKSRSLLLARDALGRKPLYYCVSGKQIWFGTRSPKAAPRGQIDRAALSDYLELGYVPAPGTTWSAVRKVPSGHLVRFSESGARLDRWFGTPLPGSGPRPSRIAVRARLEEAVRRRLADRPATLLSGGLDSSALVALMTRLSGRVRTYAAGSDEDLELARRIAERFRSEHHELRVVHRPAEDLPALIAEAGEPFADPALLAMAGLLREMHGPVLTGDGADELFAGHVRYLRAARIPELRPAASAANLLRKVAPSRLHVRRLLREAVADLLPRDVLIRPPRPPSVPIGAWLRGPLRQMVHDLVRAPTARIRTLLDPRAIDRALAQSLAPRGNPQQAWTLLCLELWARDQRG